MGPIVNQSATAMDALTSPGQCGTGDAALPGVTVAHAQGRCGYGPRLPLLVISPYANRNYVDHSVTDQTSILRFIEDNWLDQQRIPGSFDSLAGKLNTMFNFSNPDNSRLLLDDPPEKSRTDPPHQNRSTVYPYKQGNGRFERFHSYGGLVKIVRCGFLWGKPRKRLSLRSTPTVNRSYPDALLDLLC
jgi:hypothetical protein